MMFPRPTPRQERWIRVAALLGVRRDTPWLADRCGGWMAATTIARCAFFALGVFAAGLTAAILGLIHVPGYLLITGLIAIAAAEWLILDKHLFGAGIEEALEVSGLLMIALQIVDPLVNSSAVRAPLLIALALAVAGFRLLNPLFITLSVVALSFAMESAGALHGGLPVFPASMAATFCFAVAAAALLIARAQFQRPAHDRMLNWLIVAMPLAGYLWVESKNASGLTLDLLRHAPVRCIPALVLLTYGVAALIAGMRRRAHAPIMAFILCAGCMAYELRNLTNLSLQVKLIGWGGVVLLLTLALDRHLRTPRRGITSQRFEENDGPFDLLQLAGASALAPPSVQNPGSQFKGGGGAGGGGGASGSY
jgi:hypothetical protein